MSAILAIVARDDTLLGACHALGEDFGLPPNWLRALFALGLFLSPAAAVGAYAGCFAIVAVSRWLVPDPPAAAEVDEAPASDDERQAQAWEELALAA